MTDKNRSEHQVLSDEFLSSVPHTPGVYMMKGAGGNVLYVGEAGSLVDPISLEGISQALVSGRLAADSIASYLQTGEAGGLQAYEKAARRRFAHFPWMPSVGALLKRRSGVRLIEAALRRSSKWQVDETRFAEG